MEIKFPELDLKDLRAHVIFKLSYQSGVNLNLHVVTESLYICPGVRLYFVLDFGYCFITIFSWF